MRTRPDCRDFYLIDCENAAFLKQGRFPREDMLGFYICFCRAVYTYICYSTQTEFLMSVATIVGCLS